MESLVTDAVLAAVALSEVTWCLMMVVAVAVAVVLPLASATIFDRISWRPWRFHVPRTCCRCSCYTFLLSIVVL